MSRFRMGSYSQQEIDAMVSEQAFDAAARSMREAEKTPIAYMLRHRAEEAFRQVPLGEGRLVLEVLSTIRANMTTFIDRGVDVPWETAQDIAQAITACENKVA